MLDSSQSYITTHSSGFFIIMSPAEGLHFSSSYWQWNFCSSFPTPTTKNSCGRAIIGRIAADFATHESEETANGLQSKQN